MAEVETVLHGGWAEVVLNRPETKNAINGPLGSGLAAMVRDLDDNDDVQFVTANYDIPDDVMAELAG